MASETRTDANPLAAFAADAPPALAGVLSVGGRIVGAAMAAYIAADQSYDLTQVFAIGLAVVAIASCAPMPGGLGILLSGLAAGTLFFGASLLVDQAAGVGMLLAAVAAVAGVLMQAYRRGADPVSPLGAFFFGLGVTAAWWSLTFLITEGGFPFEGVLPL